MFRTWKLAPSTVTQRLAALRFLYIQVLKRNWSVAETPYPKKVLHLPEILSQQEVARLIDATETPFQRILVMTLYATGARRAEVARLKVEDIDSQRMVVHIRGGKGRKDRDVMLSPALLEALRSYWRGLRHKPTVWLFPGNRWHTSSRPVTTKVLWTACQQAALRAGQRNGQSARYARTQDAGRSATQRLSRTTLEMADIVRYAGQGYMERSRKWINGQHEKVLLAITRCRTAALGGHRDRCSGCGHSSIS